MPAVDGQSVDADVSPFECLVHQADRDVHLEVRSGKRKHVVTVRTLASEVPLRYRDFVESNREFVHDKSRGRIGYVHIPNMSTDGAVEFHRGFVPQVGRVAGLVVDNRYNGGGNISSILLEKLLRKPIGWSCSRHGKPKTYPYHSPQGPVIVVIKNGPYMVGDVELADRALGQGVTTCRYTLCRCGASKNKPFCDGSHWHAGFSDDS